ncbi:hypothetical protein Mame01_56770 [Microbispora amethystogenes]|nr:hypothetical protein Mame01_56770 [Microbispora amethystogenes]
MLFAAAAASVVTSVSRAAATFGGRSGGVASPGAFPGGLSESSPAVEGVGEDITTACSVMRGPGTAGIVALR